MPDFTRRTREEEMMDDLSGDHDQLEQTLRQFRIINWLLSRSRRLLRTCVLDHAKESGQRSFSIVDIGAGGCETMLWLSEEAARRGMHAEITCMDHDPRAVEYACARTSGNPAVKIVQADMNEISRLGPFDYSFSNHLLHHLSDAETVELLRSVQNTTRRLWVMSDIRRSRVAYYAFSVFAFLLFGKGMSYHDGRVSIRRSFTPGELAAIAHRIAEEERPGPSVRTLVPARVCVVGQGTAAPRLRASVSPHHH